MGLLGSLPHTLLTQSVQAWIAVSGGSVLYSGSATLVGLPFAFRFIWAYMADYLKCVYGVAYHNTLLCVAIATALLMFLLSYYDPLDNAKMFFAIIFFGCVLSATIDTILDGVRITITPSDCASVLTSVYCSSYRMGFLITNGLGYLIVQRVGWGCFFTVMSVMVLLLSVLVAFAFRRSELVARLQAVQDDAPMAGDSWGLVDVNTVFVNTAILVVVLKWHEVLIASLIQPFFLQGLSLSLDEVGAWLNTFGTMANIGGSMFAGFCMQTFHRRFVIRCVVLMQLAASVGFAAIAVGLDHPLWINGVIFAEKFSDGLMNTTIMMIILHYCNKGRATTENALILSLTSACRALVGPLAAGIHSLGGDWYGFFMLSALMLLPVLFVLERRVWDDFFGYEKNVLIKPAV